MGALLCYTGTTYLEGKVRFQLKEPFVLQMHAGLPLLKLTQWEARNPQISAGFTTRQGGVSQGALDSMNVALHVQDDPNAVFQNRCQLAAVLGYHKDAWTCAEQVHGNKVQVVRATHRGAGMSSRESAIQDTDALITNVPGVLLTSFYADCVPLYFYDPTHQAVGLAHAGWKGTVAKIAEKTVQAMNQAYGTMPDQLLAAIGPSIGSCCYEVDDYVIGSVQAIVQELQESGLETEEIVQEQDNGRYLLNLQKLNRQIMIKAGIPAAKIDMTSYCTSCHQNLFFSHRRDQGQTGRMASWIGIAEEVNSVESSS